MSYSVSVYFSYPFKVCFFLVFSFVFLFAEKVVCVVFLGGQYCCWTSSKNGFRFFSSENTMSCTCFSMKKQITYLHVGLVSFALFIYCLQSNVQRGN
jgi:hypothetical protein